MIIESPRNKMLATRLDCLIGPELSKPYRAGLALTESCSCSVRGFPSLTELRSRSVRPSRAGPLLGKVWLVPKPARDHLGKRSCSLELFHIEIRHLLPFYIHRSQWNPKNCNCTLCTKTHFA